ncbi:hypothetical protein OG874_24735 [Nocardia sp. NBC_00565]|uniref:hypothetical protein n=1 Tax=Nocardia sp. NBC_00565 TaxID=2975993 RepID=UPI002E80124C|nr:hypothetical protein [Nocardia sp. NBC_00565]WUC00111.1 hypothetical protein OG874_24735 [Nocardia sp. NBC_00565]
MTAESSVLARALMVLEAFGSSHLVLELSELAGHTGRAATVAIESFTCRSSRLWRSVDRSTEPDRRGVVIVLCG